MNQFEHLACIDLETTGGRPTRDRITEIGLVLVDGDKFVEEWSSLINPHIHIPVNIQQLTGISDEMVEQAPDFEDVANTLLEKLEGRVLVAHNARFDVGFLRNELRRLGIDFRPQIVCTVKLSRRLYPAYRRHNLDSLIRRHQLTCHARHRALGDARVLPDLINAMVKEMGDEHVKDAMAAQQRLISLPPHLPQSMLDKIPHRPGVYLFYGENEALLYVGKSINLKSRVLSHFSDDHRNDREMQIAQQVHHIEWKETAGEFGALMLEAKLVKSRSPLFNRKLRRQQDLYGIVWQSEDARPPEIKPVNSLTVAQLSQLFGLYRSKRQASEKLRKLADDHRLCLKLLGLEKGQGACFSYQLKKCNGACCGEEPLLKHGLRLMHALMPQKIQAWPYPGAIGIREYQSETQQSDIHIISHWCYLGTVQSEAELDSFAMPSSLNLDKDFYRLCLQQLEKNPQVLDLSNILSGMSN